MNELIAGLVLFVGVHSVRIVAEGWRSRMLARVGEKTWKLGYTALALLGLALMVHGFGQARLAPEWVFVPPPWGRHANMGLMLVSMVLLVASHSPKSHYKAWLHHPMLWATVLWGAAHLMVRHQKHDAVLFGVLTVWALLALASSYARDRRERVVYPRPALKNTLIATAVGAALYLALVLGLHKLMTGLSPVITSITIS
jgi:uncharacterized membrane protein